MKAILEFNLPEDSHDFKLAVLSTSLYSSICDFSDELRTMWKHEDLEKYETKHEVVDKIRDMFYETVGAVIDDLP